MTDLSAKSDGRLVGVLLPRVPGVGKSLAKHFNLIHRSTVEVMLGVEDGVVENTKSEHDSRSKVEGDRYRFGRTVDPGPILGQYKFLVDHFLRDMRIPLSCRGRRRACRDHLGKY